MTLERSRQVNNRLSESVVNLVHTSVQVVGQEFRVCFADSLSGTELSSSS
jgi:hypothetical protein